VTMTATAETLTYTDAAFQAFLDSRSEPGWLVDLRREAWAVFREMDWPQRRSEEWMRTDLRLFKPGRYTLPAVDNGPSEPPRALLTQDVELGGTSAAVNSRSVISRLKPDWAAKGVLFGSLDELICQHEKILRPHLMTRCFQTDYDRFAALHAACWSGGHVLYVPRGVVIDEPLHALSAMGDGGVDFGHTLVILEEGAEATMLAETASYSESDGGFHCGATEILLAPGSNLRLVSLQDWGNGVWHFAHQKAMVDRDASFQWTVGALGCKLSKVNQHVALVGPGATSQVNGVMFTEGRQHLAYHTLQHHVAPYCRSDFLYKAALQDRSRTVWRGMIKVDAGAQKTDGYQRNDNLLLSERARADSIPGLEIEADDVRCTHGSTTGNVDEELIFYAMCRGFTRKEAVRMIVSGFFQQIFDRITIEGVRNALGKAIAARVREVE
jgi:Fe-S cluster assembly protein SufD